MLTSFFFSEKQNLFDQDGALVLQERECQSGYSGLLSCWDVFADHPISSKDEHSHNACRRFFHPFAIIRWTKIIFKSANSRKQANSTDWSTTTRALRFTLEGLHQRHPNYISPGTKKGIKYRSQQALEGLRAFGWKVSGLRPGSSCQEIRTGTLSNQVA